MNCLCCGKPLHTETPSGWHAKCIKNFFGTAELPKIELTETALESIALRAIQKGFTVTGVQKKMSLHLHTDTKKDARLTLVGYPTGYILKPQSPDYNALPEAEHLVMLLAERCGIKTMPQALIFVNGEYAYITKRADRTDSGDKLAMEDFCQLGNRLTENKYKSSYETCGRILLKYSSQSGLDISELFMRIFFSWLVGNSDMHLKNFSMIETEAGSEKYVLSQAYDLLPVQIVSDDSEEMALTVNGKKKQIRRKDFLALATNLGMTQKSAEKTMDAVIKKIQGAVPLIEESVLPRDYKQKLKELITERCCIAAK